MTIDMYDQDLARRPANFASLTPLSFLERAACVHPDRVAVIHGSIQRTWSEVYKRCRRLASALARRGVQRGHTVAAMTANTPEMYEAHFGVPMCGAVLNAINTRLDAKAVAFILDHAQARVLLTDREFSGVVKDALAQCSRELLVVDIDDPNFDGGQRLGTLDYEALLAEGDPDYPWQPPVDEWDAISLNYTSGTTGNPKGVVYHHRGAHLNSLSNIVSNEMPLGSVYLWTLPMFHCNGWCYPWTLAALAGTSVCLRQVRAPVVLEAIATHRVNYLCGAPVVLSGLAQASQELKPRFDHPVTVMTGGAAPPAAVIAAMHANGFRVRHVYGLTETYGPSVICEPQPDWRELGDDELADRMARQGVRSVGLEELMVADPETLKPVPADGQTMGEILMRGNVVMKGYLKNPRASEECFRGGWFHSGDLAVRHPDGYVQIRDRSKDIIISGGENISSIEVEGVLFRHPDVIDAAVVAAPHEKWGETPCAFVTLREGAQLTTEGVIAYCREHLAHFKAPTLVVFGPIAKTATGKVQKFKLRELAREAAK